jgi:hypothetical protein
MDTSTDLGARRTRGEALAGMLGIFLQVMPVVGAPLSVARHLTQDDEDTARPCPDAGHRQAACFPDAPSA